MVSLITPRSPRPLGQVAVEATRDAEPLTVVGRDLAAANQDRPSNAEQASGAASILKKLASSSWETLPRAVTDDDPGALGVVLRDRVAVVRHERMCGCSSRADPSSREGKEPMRSSLCIYREFAMRALNRSPSQLVGIVSFARVGARANSESAVEPSRPPAWPSPVPNAEDPVPPRLSRPLPAGWATSARRQELCARLGR